MAGIAPRAGARLRAAARRRGPVRPGRHTCCARPDGRRAKRAGSAPGDTRGDRSHGRAARRAPRARAEQSRGLAHAGALAGRDRPLRRVGQGLRPADRGRRQECRRARRLCRRPGDGRGAQPAGRADAARRGGARARSRPRQGAGARRHRGIRARQLRRRDRALGTLDEDAAPGLAARRGRAQRPGRRAPARRRRAAGGGAGGTGPEHAGGKQRRGSGAGHRHARRRARGERQAGRHGVRARPAGAGPAHAARGEAHRGARPALRLPPRRQHGDGAGRQAFAASARRRHGARLEKRQCRAQQGRPRGRERCDRARHQRRAGHDLDDRRVARAHSAHSALRRALLRRRRHVDVDAEQVVGVVAPLDRLQAGEIDAIGLRDALALVLGEEVDVAATRAERRRVAVQRTRPVAAGRVVGRALPAPVDVHDAARVAPRVGGFRRRDCRHGAAELGEEDLALGPRRLLGRLDGEVDQSVVHGAEVVRLPVVACAGGEQRIEGRLERGVGIAPEVAAGGRAEAEHRRGRARAGIGVARVQHREDDHVLAVNRLGQEGQRRRLAQHRPDVEFGRRIEREIAPGAQHLGRLRQRIHDEARVDLRPDRMQRELERGHHAEVAAAAADRPEQLRFLGRRGDALAAVCGDDVGGDQVVDGHAVLARQPAEAATQAQARHAGRRVDAERRRQAEGLRFAVEVAEQRARRDARSALLRVDMHAALRGLVDHQRAVGHRVAGDVMAAAAHRQAHLVLAREGQCVAHVLRVQAARDDRRPALGHAVPDLARGVVGLRFRCDDAATDTRGECFEARGVQYGVAPVERRIADVLHGSLRSVVSR